MRALCHAPALGCLRHRLLLHRVHPAQAPDAVLLQLDCVARIRIGRIFAVQFGAAREQGLAGFVFRHAAIAATDPCAA